MAQLRRLFSLPFFAAVLAACTSTGVLAPGAATPAPSSPNVSTEAPRTPSSPVPVESPSPPPAAPIPTPVALTKAALESCPVTFPNGSQPPDEITPGLQPSPHRHGNDVLWADLGVGGKIVPAPEQFQEDGSLNWKMGWDRGVRGKLTVTGRRLDAPTPPAQGHYDIEGYGDIGFQAGGIHFPSEGCWEITGRVGDASLTFVTLVVKEPPFEYLWPAWGPEGLTLKDQDVTSLPQSFRLIFGPAIPGESQVAWGEGEVSIETTQGAPENHTPYPEAATQQLTVNGQPGVCAQGAWDEQGHWQTKADVGTLEWSAEGFSYRIHHSGLGLHCEDLLRIAGSPP